MDAAGTSTAPGSTLGRKLLIVLFAFTGLFAANFLAYNHLLRELTGTGAAVDAAGRQRMLSQKIAYLAFQVGLGHRHDRAALKELTAEFHDTLEAFKHGGPSRDFHINRAPAALAPLVRAEETEWKPYREAALTVSEAPAGGSASKKALAYLGSHSEALLSTCDSLTAAYRGTAEDATRGMEYLMLLLIGVNLLFGAAVFYYSKKRIVAPLLLLNRAAAEMTAGNYPELSDGGSDDEVGNLFNTFSKMSGTIRRDMEKRSAIGALLAVSLERGSLPELLDKFLENLLAIPWLALEAKGAVFLADAGEKSLAMTARRGVSAEVGGACASVPFGRCLCGRAAAGGETVFASELDARHEISYKGAKPHGHYCVPIKLRDRVIGVLNLYLRAGHRYEESEKAFLEAACAIIAKAIEYANLEAKAYQAQKMESLGRAAGAIAHDFNNILTVAQGFNNLALDTVPAEEEAHKFIEETASGLDRGAALVKQIMAFSRNQPAEMTSLDLNAVIERSRIMLGVILEKKIRLKLYLAPGLPRITGNTGQLEQVLVNLAVNARDAILPGTGEFSITTSETTGEAAAHCGKELGGAARVVRLSVSDTGRGMPREVIEHVFEPFFTTKPEGRGTGLGLATVYSITQRHKGGINITSRPGLGTTFDICFPATP
ncbi:MAG: type IV pili methyl-accepting chemotaxis transducer N-terminal domain-containing protein [Elusimicrobia bacterium]|nr:type IV pili methyl-accepting chemotaxis transducer N-terminal domain-containing protein [Elusimicrobiota bacterium]